MIDQFLSKKRNVFILAFIAILFESLTSPFLKMGGQHPFLSLPYLGWFCAAVALLGGYAIAWQLILEHLPLTTAYLRKGISYMLIFIWAAVLFHETITVQQIIGMIVIIIGMVVSMSDDI